MSCLQNIVEKHFAPQKVEHFNNTAFVDYLYQLSCFLRRRVRRMLGPFIREKISRSLRKTWTPRINGTKSTFTAYSTHGQLKSRLILADEFWVGLIQAAAYRGRESVCVNALIDRLVRDTAVTGDFTIRRRDGNENVQNNNRFSRQNNNYARAPHFFVHFLVVFCTTTT